MNDAAESRSPGGAGPRPIDSLTAPLSPVGSGSRRPERLAARRTPAERTLPAIVRAMRPLQWTKNAVVLAALVFDRKLLEPDAVIRALVAVLVFCALSSGVYLINDVRDAASDRLHPTKRYRPIAASELHPRSAIAVAVLLFMVGLATAWIVRPPFLAVSAGYVALMVLYSLGLKQFIILDVFAIAAGFVLRAAGGAVALTVTISPWLLVCTMLLALFIGFGKRRHELVALGHVTDRRKSLSGYSLVFLDQLIGTVASATVMAYSIYTFDASNVPRNHAMMLTIPFVAYAVFRYLFLIHRDELSGTPEALLFADRPLLLAIVAWGLSSIAILQLTG